MAIDPDPKPVFYENVEKAARTNCADVGLYREFSSNGLPRLLLDEYESDYRGFDLM